MANARTRYPIAALGLLAVAGLALPPGARAQFPTAAGDETTTSLGKFTIQVAAPYTSLVSGLISGGELSGYAWQNGLLTSPTLYDPSTTIGVSASLTEGSTGDTNGVTTGGPSDAHTIADSDMPVMPKNWEGPAGTDEVHTVIQGVNLQGMGTNNASVVVGSGNTSPNASNLSAGEVESLSSSGNPGNDFPAKSFFDVFTEITVTTSTQGSYQFYNKDALLLQATDLTSLPPRVIYTHGSSTAVPIYFVGGTNAGDEFGTLILAGHGAGYTNSADDVASFNAQYAVLLASVPEPSALVMSLIAATTLAGCGWYRGRPRAG